MGVAADPELDDGVHAGRARQGVAQLTAIHGEGDGREAVAVEDARDLPGGAQPPAGAGAGRATGLGDEGGL
jgi:hypothetical protein